MVCKKCGNFISDVSKPCPYCGSAQGAFKDLVLRAMEGEDQAISELYSRTIEKVYFAVRVLIKDEDTANDIVQDSYIKGFKSLHQLKDADSYQAWMKRIAHNKAVDWLRGQKVTYVEDFSSTEEAEVQERMEERIEYLPEDSADQRETARLLKEILDTLPEEQRVVLCMYYYDQMSSHEIAEELGISMNTVKSRLIYARKKVEIQVRDLESKGTRLHSLAPIPFFIALLHTAEKSAAEIPGTAVLQAVKAATVKGAVSEAAAAGAEEFLSEGGSKAVEKGIEKATKEAGKEVIKETSKEAGKELIKETAKKAGKETAKQAFFRTAAGKAVLAVTATAVIGGGVAGGIHMYNKNKPEPVPVVTPTPIPTPTPTVTPTPIPTPTVTPTPIPTPTPTPKLVAISGTHNRKYHIDNEDEIADIQHNYTFNLDGSFTIQYVMHFIDFKTSADGTARVDWENLDQKVIHEGETVTFYEYDLFYEIRDGEVFLSEGDCWSWVNGKGIPLSEVTITEEKYAEES